MTSIISGEVQRTIEVLEEITAQKQHLYFLIAFLNDSGYLTSEGTRAQLLLEKLQEKYEARNKKVPDWYIFSKKHLPNGWTNAVWWRPEAKGYTESLEYAGLYTDDESRYPLSHYPRAKTEEEWCEIFGNPKTENIFIHRNLVPIVFMVTTAAMVR